MRVPPRPTRLVALLFAALAMFACGTDESAQAAGPGNSDPQTSATLPPTPGPVTLTVDGETLPPDRVDAYLDDTWSDWYRARTEPPAEDEAAALFFARPDELFAPVVRAWLLQREGLAPDESDQLGDLLPLTVVEFTDPDGEVHVLDVRP